MGPDPNSRATASSSMSWVTLAARMLLMLLRVPSELTQLSCMLRPWRLLKQQASARQHARRQTFVAGQLQTMASFQAHSSITPVHSVAILIRSSSYTSTVVALPVLQLLPRPWARIRRCSTSRLLLLRVQLASARLSARKQTSRNGPRRCQQARFLVHLVLTFRVWWSQRRGWCHSQAHSEELGTGTGQCESSVEGPAGQLPSSCTAPPASGAPTGSWMCCRRWWCCRSADHHQGPRPRPRACPSQSSCTTTCTSLPCRPAGQP